jgi:hypothetical protein
LPDLRTTNRLLSDVPTKKTTLDYNNINEQENPGHWIEAVEQTFFKFGTPHANGLSY